MKTEWKVIDKFKNYAVSTNGEVKNIKTGRVLKQWNNTTGYKMVDLSHDGISYHKHVHRLVAEAFIPNPDNKPTVDHIDRNRVMNTVDNLRWAKRTEQSNNRRKANYGHAKTKVVASKNGITLMFDSQKECAKQLGLHVQSVNGCLRGRLKTTGGYMFRYLERSEVNAS